MNPVNPVRDIPVLDLVVSLRAAVGIQPLDRPVVAHVPPNVGLGLVIKRFDADAWVTWAIGTAPIFSDGLPSLEAMRASTNQTLVAMAMTLSDGKIGRAATRLMTGRRLIREHLQAAELYPWTKGARRGE